ncbi:MAG: NAD(+)/NADH kinase [Sarcina sp.]
MKKVGILINKTKDSKGIIEKLVKEKANQYLEPDQIIVMGHLDGANEFLLEDMDILMVLGGDGTLLGTARNYANIITCPILGINIGNLGFISSIELSEIDIAMQSIKDHNYGIEERIMIKTLINGIEFEGNRALNDVVIARGTLSRMTEYDIFVNEQNYTSFNGDGIIISTPVGSTAYSLSAGGPLISPDLDLISIVPICSHNLNTRPLVVNGNSEITIRPAIEEEIYLTIDGQKSIKLKSNDEIKIQKAHTTFKVISFKEKKYFEVLRKKIFCRVQNTKGL